MRATRIHGPGDIRLEEVPDPQLEAETDAIVQITATCVCGSDLWPYRDPETGPRPRKIGHEFVGVVAEAGAEVAGVGVGDFVIGPFTANCGTCAHCEAGVTSACEHCVGYDGCQAEYVRVPMASSTLVSIETTPSPELIPSLLACSDVLGTGWHAAISAGVRPGDTVVVVGDGAVGLCAVLASKQLGAARIVAMSRHATRQALAREFGATDIVAERGDAGVAAVLDLTQGVGADAVCECVGTGQAMDTAIACARAGARVGYVGIPHFSELPIGDMFSRNVGVAGGLAPVREYLPGLASLVTDKVINPGKVFDLELPLDKVAEAYRAMDAREAIKVLLRP